jgi:hypothetical protein
MLDQSKRAILAAQRLTKEGRARPSTAVSALEARVLRATAPTQTRSADQIARLARVETVVALSCLQRLGKRYLVDDDGSSPRRWRRTRHGDVALEHAAD